MDGGSNRINLLVVAAIPIRMDHDDGTLQAAEIRAALARVLASPAFQSAPQLAAFLTFVVEKRLAGEAASIKGYTIATQALGRPEDFDPQADPIVRVEAGRLRRVLTAYYEGLGQEDPIRILIPRGGYVPSFKRAAVAPESPPPTEAESAPAPAPETVPAPEPPAPAPPDPSGRGRVEWLPGFAAVALVALVLVAGRSFVDSGPARGSPDSARIDGRPLVGVAAPDPQSLPAGRFSPAALRTLVLDALARFDEIVVFDLAAGGAANPESGRYVLDLRVQPAGETVSVTARLGYEPSGRVVWVRSFDPARRADPAASPEADIARQIATSLGQPSGVLFADLRSRPDLNERTRCVVQVYDHWRNPSREAHARGRDCLEAVVAAQPNAATALADLAFFYIEEHCIGYNARPEPLERAMRVARQAIELAPESPRANQALMDVLFARNEVAAALARGRHAVDLNPNDTDILAGYGSKLVQTGRYREGADFIRRAAEANPAAPPWYDFFLFLAAFMQDDWPAAKAAAARIEAPHYVPGFLAKIVVAGRNGQDAQPLVGKLVTVQPEYGTSPESALARRNFSPDIQVRLLEELRRAGLGA